MASLYKTVAAVCLVALSGLQSEVAATTVTYKFTPVVVDDAAYLAAKLVRNGRLPVRISEVEKSESIVTNLTDKIKKITAEKDELEATDLTCSALKKDDLKNIFHYTFKYQESLNYRELLQKALEEGLEVFKENKDQRNWETIWESDAGASLAHLLGANSTEIGCIIGQCTTSTSGVPTRQSPSDGTTGQAVLFCELSPAAEKGKAPFDDEYYDGLIARTAKLEEMTEEDLKANDGTAAASIPAILAAGLVTLLTVVSV